MTNESKTNATGDSAVHSRALLGGNSQHSLFELDPAWRIEWQGMPEFVMEDHSPHRTINIHFRNDEDVAAFAKLIGQRISPKQKAAWYPEAKPRRYADKIYADEP